MTRLRVGASILFAASAMLLGTVLIPTAASADPISGAIFTTDVTGTEVNANQYAAKPDVYLNGGPGLNAPIGAAGLSPDGTYVFTGTAGPCPHATGGTITQGSITSITVQLCTPPDPGSCFNDTPNNGGVYKVWMTPLAQYGCDVTVVDCGNSGGFKHGFLPSDSKTDNFKVKSVPIREIDTQFAGSDGQLIDGLGVIWADPLGATNQKWSEYNPSVLAYHEAHVEAVEPGTHYITIYNQPGCTVTGVSLRGGNFSANGPTTVPVKIPGGTWPISVHIDVTCA